MSTEDAALAEIKEKFTGKWKVDRSECFEDFLREVGVNFVVRKMAGMARPTAIIKVEDGKIHIETDAGFFTNVDDIKLNVEYDKEQKKVMHKAIATYEDGVLKIKLTPVDSNIKPQTVTREIVGDELLLTMYIADVVCKRYFKRLE